MHGTSANLFNSVCHRLLGARCPWASTQQQHRHKYKTGHGRTTASAWPHSSRCLLLSPTHLVATWLSHTHPTYWMCRPNLSRPARSVSREPATGAVLNKRPPCATHTALPAPGTLPAVSKQNPSGLEAQQRSQPITGHGPSAAACLASPRPASREEGAHGGTRATAPVKGTRQLQKLDSEGWRQQCTPRSRCRSTGHAGGQPSSRQEAQTCGVCSQKPGPTLPRGSLGAATRKECPPHPQQRPVKAVSTQSIWCTLSAGHT